MPSRTEFRPHAISCIKDSVREVLSANSGDNLTISCDRSDCWADDELFKWRQAINIVTGSDVVGDPYKSPRQGRKLGDTRPESDSECLRKTYVNFTIQVYVSECFCSGHDCGCMDTKSHALAILGHVSRVLFSNQSQLLGHRLQYSGSDTQKEDEGDEELVMVTGSFRIDYISDQTDPSWVG